MTVELKIAMWDGKTPDLPVEVVFEGKNAEQLATSCYWALVPDMGRGHIIRVDSETPDEIATIHSFDHAYDAYLERRSNGDDEEEDNDGDYLP
jgi:hypothetical protein